MKIISYLVILILLVFGISFAILNASYVTVHYYTGSVSLPLSLLLVITFSFGALCGLMVGLIMYCKASCRARHAKHELKRANKEIDNLRSTSPASED